MTDTLRVPFRVWLDQIDFYGFHMNNAYYFTSMELCRVDFFIRCTTLSDMYKKGIYPQLGGISYQFRRELGPFELYNVATRVLCVDEKWLYVEHVFESAKSGKFIGRGIARMCLAQKKRGITVQDALKQIGQESQFAELRAKFDQEHLAKTFVEHDQHLKEKTQ